MADDPILQFFRYEHLPERLSSLSRPFGALAHHLTVTLPRNPERTVALRKLLEAKDAAVRAALYEAAVPEAAGQEGNGGAPVTEVRPPYPAWPIDPRD